LIGALNTGLRVVSCRVAPTPPSYSLSLHDALPICDKLPNDPGVTSALTDLMPYTLIAAEQSIAREEFAEAQRLSAIIEKADPKADRKSTRLNSSHVKISYAVFCLKKKNHTAS